MSLSKPICEHCGRILPASGAIRIHSANGQGGARWRCLECDSRILRRSHEEIAYYHAVERDQYMLWRLCLDVGAEANHATANNPRRALSTGNGLVRWRPLDQSTTAVAAERHPAAAACAADDRARWSDPDPDFDAAGDPEHELELDLDADDDDRAGRASLRCTCGGRRLESDRDLDEADEADDDADRPRRLATGLDAAGLAVLIGVVVTLVLYLLTLYLTGVIH